MAECSASRENDRIVQLSREGGSLGIRKGRGAFQEALVQADQESIEEERSTQMQRSRSTKLLIPDVV